jgi:hypothetical protein
MRDSSSIPNEVSGQLSGDWGRRPRLHFLRVQTMPHAMTKSPIIEIRAIKIKLKSQLEDDSLGFSLS